jgi:hypothetical protein
MTMQNVAGYTSQARTHTRKVRFTGSEALPQGVGVCYVRDYTSSSSHEAATDPFGGRDKRVALPTSSNNRWFAGVATNNYDARVGGQLIEIAEPGSVCQVAVGVNAVIDVTRMCCSAGAGDPGRFTMQGLPGRGSAIALQTKAAAILESSLTGGWALDSTGLILTVVSTAGIAAGDKVFIVHGESDGTNVCTPGEYTVASVTDATTLVLTSAASDGGTMQCSGYILNGNPLVLAYLEDGEESGLQEVISPVNNAAAAAMVGGKTYVGGGVTLAAGVSTATLADGDAIGLKKALQGLGTLTTNGWLLTITNGRQQACDGTTGAVLALVSVTIDAAAERWFGQWGGDYWREIDTKGATLAAS